MALLKTSEVARILRVSEQTVRKLIRQRKLNTIAVGRSIRIDSAALANFLKGETTDATLNNHSVSR
jgi:excisionase family DNA binding protein